MPTEDADELRASVGLPPATIDTDECKIRGADGEWYEVPQPVLVQHMVTLGMSTAGMQKHMPHLVRPGEATLEDRVSVATDGNFALLATDELLAKVTAYLESGDPTLLADTADLCESLARIQGVDLEVVREARKGELGSYNGRVVLHPVKDPDAEQRQDA